MWFSGWSVAAVGFVVNADDSLSGSKSQFSVNAVNNEPVAFDVRVKQCFLFVLRDSVHSRKVGVPVKLQVREPSVVKHF